MDIKEYLQRATAKIYNSKKKEAVSLELEDHILLKEAFFEEIGFEHLASEEKAVENMGETEHVAEQFGSIHNDYHSYVFEIIGVVLWLGVMFASYYLLSQYILGDVGAVPVTLATGIFFIGASVLFSAINVIRNRKTPLFLNLIASAGTAAYLFLISLDIVKCGYSNVKSLADLMLNGVLAGQQASTGFKIPLTVSVSFFVFLVLVFILNLIIVVRYEKQENTLADNHFKKILKKFLFALGTALIVCAVAAGLSEFNVQNKIQTSYVHDYKLLFDMIENCEHVSEVEAYAKDKGLNYTAQDDSVVINADIALITVNKFEEKEEEEENILITIIADAIRPYFPETKGNKIEFTACFTLDNMSSFKNGYDSIALKKIHTDYEDMDILFDKEAREIDYTELLDVYGSFYPKSITISASDNRKSINSDVKFEYVAGVGKNAFTQEFTQTLICKNAQIVEKQKEEMMEILNENPRISNEELAKALNIKYTTPKLSKIELKSLLLYSDVLAIDEQDKTFEEVYNFLHCFYFSEDLQAYRFDLIPNQNTDEKDKRKVSFVLFSTTTNLEYVDIIIYDNDEDEENEEKYNSVRTAAKFKKVERKGFGYYDKNGRLYTNPENVAYYAENGERFRYYEETDSEGKRIAEYFIGSNGTTCSVEDGYVDKDGYFVCDRKSEFIKTVVVGNTDLVKEYHDKDANQYRKAYQVSWNSKGEMLNYDEYLEK